MLIHALLLSGTAIAQTTTADASEAALRRALLQARAAADQAEQAAIAARAAAAAARQAAVVAEQAQQVAVRAGLPAATILDISSQAAQADIGRNALANPAQIPATNEPGVVADIRVQTPKSEVADNSRPSLNPAGFQFGFNGYLRTGAGLNSRGGDQSCFGLPGVNKYRLGNECETFSELQPSVGFPIGKDGVQALYTLMIGYYDANGASRSIAGGSESVAFDIRQNWIGFTGFHGLLEGATVWGGRRYYQRHDIHVQDFFYWSQRGQGIGVEGVETPIGKVSVALMNSYNNVGPSSIRFTNGAAGNTLDVRLAQINTNPHGQLELGFEARGTTTQGDAKAKGGFLLTAEHVQKEVLGGSNRFTVQYGTRAGANLSSNDAGAFFFTDDRTSAFRVIDQLLIEPNPDLSLFIGTVFQSTRNYRFNGRLIGRRDWLSIGTRPQWHWSDHLSSAVEIGYDSIHYVDDESRQLSGATARLTKVTVAPIVLKLGRAFFDRPELRMFGTCARWNRDADLSASASGYAGNNITGNANYFGARKGCSIGAQIEAWW